MSVAKVIEVSSSSKTSFEDAVKTGIQTAGKTISGIKSAWVKDQNVIVENNAVVEYRVNLKITFVLK